MLQYIYAPLFASSALLLLGSSILMLRKYMQEWDEYKRFIEGFGTLILVFIGAMFLAALHAVTFAATP
ncbi:MAG: hypothetical protein DSY37_02450 [Hyperthermus sp.]|nr:MAG: hypothetical protein DSY37_02450 [Hyperthermus sp.]